MLNEMYERYFVEQWLHFLQEFLLVRRLKECSEGQKDLAHMQIHDLLLSIYYSVKYAKSPSLDGVTDCFVSKGLVIRKILCELKIVKGIKTWENPVSMTISKFFFILYFCSRRVFFCPKDKFY